MGYEKNECTRTRTKDAMKVMTRNLLAYSGNDLWYLLTFAEYVPLRETIITALLTAGR